MDVKPFQQKTFINACLTGMVYDKGHNPNVPLTCEEIIEQSLSLASAGVSILHLHARDEEGKPTWRKEIYKRIIGGIREKNEDVVICVSTSGRLWSDFERRSEVLTLEDDYKPDMGSLTPGSLNFIHSASVNSSQMIADLSQKMLDLGVKPEIEIFDTGMLNQMHVLIKKGILKEPYYVNVLFGNIYTMQLDLQNISFILNHLPEKTLTAFAGLGNYQSPAIHLALALNKGIRVGLEDNLYLDDSKRVLATNEALIEKSLRVIQAMEKEIYTTQEIRDILDLSPVRKKEMALTY